MEIFQIEVYISQLKRFFMIKQLTHSEDYLRHLVLHAKKYEKLELLETVNKTLAVIGGFVILD